MDTIVAQAAVDGEQSDTGSNTSTLVTLTNKNYMRRKEDLSMIDVQNEMIASSSSRRGPCIAKENRCEDNLSCQRLVTEKIIKVHMERNNETV